MCYTNLTKPITTEDDFYRKVIRSGKKRGKKRKKDILENGKNSYKFNVEQERIEVMIKKCNMLIKMCDNLKNYYKLKSISEQSYQMEMESTTAAKVYEERPCIISESCEIRWKNGSKLHRHLVEHHEMGDIEAKVAIFDHFKSTGETNRARRWKNEAENSPVTGARKKLLLETPSQTQKRTHSSDDEEDDEDKLKKAREDSPDRAENYQRDVTDVLDFINSPERPAQVDDEEGSPTQDIRQLLGDIQEHLGDIQEHLQENGQEMEIEAAAEDEVEPELSKNDPEVLRRIAEHRASKEAEEREEEERRRAQASYMEMKDNYIRASQELELANSNISAQGRTITSKTFEITTLKEQLRKCKEANKNLLEDKNQLKINQEMLMEKVKTLRNEKNAAIAAKKSGGSMDWRVQSLATSASLKDEEISALKNQVKTLEKEIQKAQQNKEEAARKARRHEEGKKEAEEAANKASKSDKEALEQLEAAKKTSEGMKKELVKMKKKMRCNDKNCPSEEVCGKSHDFKEQEKKTLCQQYKRGHCKWGEECKFLHCDKTRSLELKKMASVLSDYEKHRGEGASKIIKEEIKKEVKRDEGPSSHQPSQTIRADTPVLPGVSQPQVIMQQNSGIPMNLRPESQPMINMINRPAPPPGFENGSYYGASSSTSGYGQVDNLQRKIGNKSDSNQFIQTPPGSQKKIWPTSGSFWYNNIKDVEDISRNSNEYETSTSINKSSLTCFHKQGASWRVGHGVPQSNQGAREYAEMQQVLERDRYFNAVDNRNSARMREQEELAALSRLQEVQRWEALRRTTGDIQRNPTGHGF